MGRGGGRGGGSRKSQPRQRGGKGGEAVDRERGGAPSYRLRVLVRLAEALVRLPLQRGGVLKGIVSVRGHVVAAVPRRRRLRLRLFELALQRVELHLRGATLGTARALKRRGQGRCGREAVEGRR